MAVTRRLPTPRRAIHPHFARREQAQDRLVVVQQAGFRDMLQPQTGMGALAYARRTYEHCPLVCHRHARSVYQNRSLESRRINESQHNKVVQQGIVHRRPQLQVGLHLPPMPIGTQTARTRTSRHPQLHAAIIRRKPNAYQTSIRTGAYDRLPRRKREIATQLKDCKIVFPLLACLRAGTGKQKWKQVGQEGHCFFARTFDPHFPISYLQDHGFAPFLFP